MKLLTKMLGLLLFSGWLFADMVVPASALPQNAQAFIQSNFPGANVMYVEQDYDDFEVRLSTGVKIDFWRDGNWKNVENYQGVNPAILPAPVAGALAKSYAGVAIVKVEKEWNGFEIKLANMLKVYIDGNGNIIGQKFDD